MSTSFKGSIPHLDDLTICYDFSNPRQFDTSAAYNVHKRLVSTETATFTKDEIEEEVYKANGIIWEPWGSGSNTAVGARNLAANGKHDAWSGTETCFQTQINGKWYFELWDFLNQWPDNPANNENTYRSQAYAPSGLFEQKDVLGPNRYYQGSLNSYSTYWEDYGWFSEKTFEDLVSSRKKIDNSGYNPSDGNGLINGKPACRMFARIRILENNTSDTGALNRWEVYVRDDELINTDDTNHQLVPGMTVEVGDYGMWEIGPPIETLDYPTHKFATTDRGGRWIYHCIRPTLTNNFPQPVHAIDKFLKPTLPLQPVRTPFIELNDLISFQNPSTGQIYFQRYDYNLNNGVGNIEFNVNDFDEADCPSSSAWEMYLYEQNTGKLHSFHRKLLGDTVWTTMMGNHHTGFPNYRLPYDWGNASPDSSNPGITLQYSAYFYKLEHKRRDMFNSFSTFQKDTAWPGVVYPDFPNALTGCHQKAPLYINEDLVIGDGNHLEEFSYFCWVKHRGHSDTYKEATIADLSYGNYIDFTLLSFSEERFEFKVDKNYRLSLVALLGTNHGFPELYDTSKGTPSDHEYCDIKSPQIVKDMIQSGWVQLGFTYSQSNRQVKFYVNGELISTHTSTTTAGQNALKLGDYNSGTDIFTNSTSRRGFILGRPDNNKSNSWKTTANSSNNDRNDVVIYSQFDIIKLALNSVFMWKDRLITDTEVTSLYNAKAEMLGGKPVPAKVQLPTQPSIMADAISGAVNSFTSDSSPASVVNALQGLGHKVWAIVDEDHCSGTDLVGQVPTADETTSGIQSLTAVGKFAKLYFDQNTSLGVTSGFADDELNGLPYMCIVGFDEDRYLGSSFIIFAEDQYGDYVIAEGSTPNASELVFQPTGIRDIIKQTHLFLGNNTNFSNSGQYFLFNKDAFFIKGFTQDESGYNNVEYFDRSKKITVKKGTNEVQWHLCTDLRPGSNGYHNSNEFNHNHSIAWAWSPDEQRTANGFRDDYWFCGHQWMYDGRMNTPSNISGSRTSDSHGPHSVVDYTPDNYEFWGLVSAADSSNNNVNTYSKWGNYEISSTNNPTFYIIS